MAVAASPGMPALLEQSFRTFSDFETMLEACSCNVKLALHEHFQHPICTSAATIGTPKHINSPSFTSLLLLSLAHPPSELAARSEAAELPAPLGHLLIPDVLPLPALLAA